MSINRNHIHATKALAKILPAVILILSVLFCIPASGAANSRMPGNSSVQYADTLTEREKMVKTLIETVQTILSNDKPEQVSPAPTRHRESEPTLKNETIYHSYPKTGNNNPRPYLGPDLSGGEYNITGSEFETELGEPDKVATEIPERRNPFPFLSPDNSDNTPGNYLWIPDSLYDQVQMLLEGNGSFSKYPKRALKQEIENPEEELVVFRGDTIPMIIRDRKFGRFDRKLFNYLAYPRGIWGASLTASYGELSTDNMELLSLLSDVTIKGHIFSIKPSIYYFVRSNLAIGVRLSYTEGNAGIESFNVDIDDDMNFSLSDIGYHTESYQAGLTLTRYYGLSRRSRIHLTNEVELGFASGNSDFRRPYNGVPKETHTTTMKASLTYSPGVSVQIMKNVSFDLSFGAFGLYVKSERQTVDGVKEGTRTTSGANFRFNIFNINFGIGVHL